MTTSGNSLAWTSSKLAWGSFDSHHERAHFTLTEVNSSEWCLFPSNLDIMWAPFREASAVLRGTCRKVFFSKCFRLPRSRFPLGSFAERTLYALQPNSW